MTKTYAREGTMLIDTKPIEYSDFTLDPLNQAKAWKGKSRKKY